MSKIPFTIQGRLCVVSDQVGTFYLIFCLSDIYWSGGLQYPAMSSSASNSSQSNRETGGDDEKRSKRESRRANSTRVPKTVSAAAKRSDYQLSEDPWNK